jgi:WXG100 family type VII secretion target
MADRTTHAADEVLHSSVVVAQVRQDVDGDLAKLRQAIVTLVSEGWQGSASEAFRGTMEQWDANAKKLMQALEQIGNMLKTSAYTFTSVQQEIERSMQAQGVDYSDTLG